MEKKKCLVSLKLSIQSIHPPDYSFQIQSIFTLYNNKIIEVPKHKWLVFILSSAKRLGRQIIIMFRYNILYLICDFDIHNCVLYYYKCNIIYMNMLWGGYKCTKMLMWCDGMATVTAASHMVTFWCDGVWNFLYLFDFL